MRFCFAKSHFFIIIIVEGVSMSIDTLTSQIRALPESCISELSDFIVYLQMKVRFAEFEEHSDRYKMALSKWRQDSQDLFDNEEDALFMQHAFDDMRSKEVYNAKEIW